ncbi:hypothetical protein DTO169E5_5588 [Paecilomyces variotii]|nr:hypothetical protein DTO169E5_5588 [Paecilomyces variotii]KAJ9308220.1 hypothetical protein DTO217A2_2202 [Paecilomyces variotii]
MSYYYDDRRYRSNRDRYRPTGYVEETYVDSRGGDNGRMELVRRYDDSDDEVIEEVQRDFPPGEYSYGIPRRSKTTTIREGVRRARSVGGQDPYYGGGYYRRGGHRRPRGYDDRRDHRSKYSSSSRSPSPRPRRRKSFSEQALGALGLGGVLGAAAGKNRDDDRGRPRRERRRHRRSYSYSSSPSRSRSRHRDKSEGRIAQAVKTAITAGAAEAFRLRKEPGPWNGEKGRRVLTAAIAASGVDGLIDRDPKKHTKRHIIEATLAGLAANHLLNGPASRSQSRKRGGSRGRSQSRGGIKDIASAGVLAAAGKEIYDRDLGRLGWMTADILRTGRVVAGGHWNGTRMKTPTTTIHPTTITARDVMEIGIENSDEKRMRKKMRRNEFLTAGLATVATIHAAHNVVKSIEKRKKRQEQLKEGKITPEEARKRKQKALLGDAASIGLAALGIKGAISEWKEAKEKREEAHKFMHECEERRRKREARRTRSHSASYPSRRHGSEYSDANPYSSRAWSDDGY